jgi:hypothetical protein
MPDQRPHVVILTAGALPGQDTPDPHATQLAAVPALKVTLTRLNDLGVHGGDPGRDVAVGAALDAMAAAYWRAGWADAAKEHRVVAVYVLPDGEEAARFAAFMTGEVDPAYHRAASSPVDELLRHAENCAGRVIS